MRGSGLFVFAPSGQVTLRAVVQSPPEAPNPTKALRAPSGPPPGVSPSRAVPQPTRIYARGPASPTRGRPQARHSSLLVQLQNRKSE